MENRRSREWMLPPADQWVGVWGPVLIAVVGITTSSVLAFFSKLTGMHWICTYLGALAIAALGIGLLFYAKLPLYRERRFFTFGPGPLPEERRPAYWWGYRCAIFASVLFACLALARN